MAVVKGFHAILYNSEKTGDLSNIVAPPYDVIDSAGQESLYEKHPLNFVRLILSKEPGEKRYISAAETLKKWLDEKILQREEKPAIFQYFQDFEFEGNRFTRKGFIAAVKIEGFKNGVVLPHEKTFKKHKDDRLKLTEACEANLSQVFSIYSDPEGLVEKTIENSAREPFAEIDFEGIKNTVWKVNDEETLARVSDLMSDKKLLIADGHHRYETAINYRNKRGGNGLHEYVMMFLCRAEGNSLVVGPTHRAVKNFNGISGAELAVNLKKEFECAEISAMSEEKLRRDQIIFVYDKCEKSLVFSPENKEKTYKTMGVITLQNTIIEKIIEGKMSAPAPEIIFIKSRAEILKLIKTGECEAGFIMPDPLIKDVMDAAEQGVRMPQKTTYFYPKILSGIAINPLWN
ncbi:MAG: DUF1015 family protein [Candidatus Mycalebacterium zealandia]|nr:MAG: DUF1015 family protein [Candidatus Mycalebacterium zealandia]